MSEKENGVTLARRAVLVSGAAAVAGGGVVIAGAGAAGAANGDPIVLGQSNTSSLTTTVEASGGGFRVNVSGTGTAAHALVGSGRNAYGVMGFSSDHNGAKLYTLHADRHGVWVENTSAVSGTGVAMWARHSSAQTGANGATAVRGFQGPQAEQLLVAVRAQHWPGAGEFAGATGVIGASNQPGGKGVVGYSEAGVGVWAETATPGEDALHAAGNATVDGDATVNGMLTKMGGSFRIDHPLDPANRYLSHSFVESPDMMNVYNGVVDLDATGAGVVVLPEWFEALNSDYRYQLTPLGAPAPNLHVSVEIKAGQFAIAGGQPAQRVSWQVTGVRKDPWAEDNRIPVEHPKPDADRGTYLYPRAQNS